MYRSPEEMTVNVSTHFQKASSHAARITLENYAGSDDARWLAAFSLGASVEYMAKAYLAAINPLLILEKLDKLNDLPSILALSETSSAISVDVDRNQAIEGGLKTIGGPDACGLARKIGCRFPYNQSVHKRVFDVRNLAVHSAVVRASTLREAVLLGVQLIEGIRKELKVNQKEYWGRFQALASDLLSNEQDVVQATAHAAIAAARERFETRISLSPPGDRKLVTESIAGQISSRNYQYAQQLRCPACSCLGWLVCDEDSVLTQRRRKEGSTDIKMSVTPAWFECSACDLQVTNELLDTLDVPDEIHVTVEMHAHYRSVIARTSLHDRLRLWERDENGVILTRLDDP